MDNNFLKMLIKTTQKAHPLLAIAIFVCVVFITDASNFHRFSLYTAPIEQNIEIQKTAQQLPTDNIRPPAIDPQSADPQSAVFNTLSNHNSVTSSISESPVQLAENNQVAGNSDEALAENNQAVGNSDKEAAENSQAAGNGVKEFIIHHVGDSAIWHPFPYPLSDITVYFPSQKLFTLGGQEIYFSNGLHATMLVIAFILLCVVFIGLYRRDATQAPRGLTNLLETFVVFIRNNIAIEYLGEKDGKRFAPFFLTVFFMILSLNLMGLVPLFSTATANVNVTAAFACVTLAAMVVGGIVRNGALGFFKLFVPAGVPTFLVPVLFVLEFVGLFIKPFALTIRLFANLLAGHIVIFSILGVIITFGLFGLPILGLGLFIYLLEIFVAFLQAYIFTLLSAIFIGEMLHPSH
ncbi:ATP synthase subunit a [Spirochaetota bacterium]|nr:ATP synthase subunit a [Spirochaetota bacterium]